MTPTEYVVLALGGNVALLAVLGWLARSLIGQLLTKDLERFKSDLASASTVATERLKHELQLVAQEHQILATKLHERRAQVVADVYGLLAEAQWAAQEFVSPASFVGDPSKPELYVSAMNKAADFYRHFDKHRIYLPENVCSQLDSFVSSMRKQVIGFGIYVRLDEATMGEQLLRSKQEAWGRASEYFASEVPKARTLLEQELRSIIGASQRRAG